MSNEGCDGYEMYVAAADNFEEAFKKSAEWSVWWWSTFDVPLEVFFGFEPQVHQIRQRQYLSKSSLSYQAIFPANRLKGLSKDSIHKTAETDLQDAFRYLYTRKRISSYPPFPNDAR